MNSDPQTENWQPTASIEALKFRAELLRAVRAFFHDEGYFEVETPLVSKEIINDAHIEPIAFNNSHEELFLQTSPEAGMKRLLAAGAEKIFQVTKSFRGEEVGRLHNPEFTMIEWYAVGTNHHDQMEWTQNLIHHVQSASRPVNSKVKWNQLPNTIPILSYDSAFEQAIGVTVLDKPTSHLIELAKQQSITIPEGLPLQDRDSWLNLLLSECVEPKLKQKQAVFLCDYPASQSALAKVRTGNPPIAERFELYLDGIEICNGYNELTDSRELEVRMKSQNDIRKNEGRRTLPPPNQLINAMKAGLPDCSGVALGFDRLAMIAGGFASISEIIPFPQNRA